MSINQPPGYVYVTQSLLDTMRRQTRKFLLHTYTRQTRLPADNPDSWNLPGYQFSNTVSGIPCFYAVKEVPIVTPEGLTTLNLPVLTLGYDDTTQVGDLVTNILTTDGTVLLSGPVLVESLQPRDPNMGGPVLIEAHLRDVEFVPSSNQQT